MVRCSLIAMVLLLACGRTEPVRYSSDGGELLRSEDGGLLPCIDGRVSLVPVKPVVMLALDRSTSMNQNIASGGSKWRALTTALHAALPPVTSDIELGLAFFPAPGSGQTCGVSSSVELAPAFENANAALTLIDGTSPGGATPTALGIEVAGAALRARRTAGSARALILATDGAPDCNTSLDSRTCTCINGNSCSATRCLDDVRTISKVTELASAGVPTWVIGIGSGDATFIDVLNRLAVAGGKPRAGSQRFYSATSQAELTAAFVDIEAQVGSCVFLMSSIPELGGSVTMTVDGEFLPYDAQNGWSWIDVDNGEIRLNGDACANAVTPVATLDCEAQ